MALRPEVRLLPHQKEGISYMLAHNYVLNADEQGLGKSLQAIAIQQAGDLDCLIICPATLKYNWQEEFFKFTDETRVTVGLKKNKINITNYENMYKCTELVKSAHCVIVDEAHYLVNMDADRTKTFHSLIERFRPERLILLTGTPMKERVTNLFSLTRLMSLTPIKNNGRSILSKYDTQAKFNNHFSNKVTFNTKVKLKRGGYFNKQIVKFTGTKNLGELKDILKHKYIRRLASKVLDLPKVIYKDVAAKKLDKSDDLLEQFNKKSKGEKFDMGVKVGAARDIAPHTADYVKDLILAGEKPVIVFSDHIEPLEIIENRLKKFTVSKIIGDTPVEMRQSTVKDFQEGKIDVLLCSYGAASTGLTLTKSWNMFLNDLTWEAAVMSQAIKRFDRIGQTRKPIIHRMVGSHAAKKILKILSEKDRDIEKVIGD